MVIENGFSVICVTVEDMEEIIERQVLNNDSGYYTLNRTKKDLYQLNLYFCTGHDYLKFLKAIEKEVYINNQCAVIAEYNGNTVMYCVVSED